MSNIARFDFTCDLIVLLKYRQNRRSRFRPRTWWLVDSREECHVLFGDWPPRLDRSSCPANHKTKQKTRVPKGKCLGWLGGLLLPPLGRAAMIVFVDLLFLCLTCIFLYHLSPDVILCGWSGSTHQLTNKISYHQLLGVVSPMESWTMDVERAWRCWWCTCRRRQRQTLMHRHECWLGRAERKDPRFLDRTGFEPTPAAFISPNITSVASHSWSASLRSKKKNQ